MSCEPNHRRASASSVCSRSRVMPTRKGPRAARRRGPQRCRRSPGTHALHLSAIAQSLALHLVDDRDLPLLAPAILPNLPGCPLAAFRVADDLVQFRPGNPFKVRQFIPHDLKLRFGRLNHVQTDAFNRQNRTTGFFRDCLLTGYVAAVQNSTQMTHSPHLARAD